MQPTFVKIPGYIYLSRQSKNLPSSPKPYSYLYTWRKKNL